MRRAAIVTEGSARQAQPLAYIIPQHIYWLGLLVLLAVERLTLVPFEVDQSYASAYPWIWLIDGIENTAGPFLIIVFATAALLSWNVLKLNLGRFTEQSAAAWRWLGIHLAFLVTLLVWSAIGSHLPPSPIWPLWILARLALEMLVLATWIVAALPPPILLQWFHSARSAFAIGLGVALGTKAVTHFTQLWWELSRKATFRVVAMMLRLLGQVVIAVPERSHLGTSRFAVEISPRCSGLEGVLISGGLLAVFLWRYRREFRFPAALILLPAGILLAWFLNAVRITMLILIGGWNPTIAIDGFHSVAGWLSLCLVITGCVVAGFRVPALRISAPQSSAGTQSTASLYLVPLIAVIATAMLTKAIHPGFDLLYPARVGVAAATLWFYRRELSSIWSAPSALAIVLGAAVFVAWFLIVPSRDAAFDSSFAAGLGSLSIAGRAMWIAVRVVGATITVPIIEELAFRGYLMRKLVADDFDSVPIGTFTWLSFLGSSILFGAMHSQWIAGTLAGMAFAGAACRRGKLADAIAAHAVANAMLSALVLATHSWSLWS